MQADLITDAVISATFKLQAGMREAYDVLNNHMFPGLLRWLKKGAFACMLYYLMPVRCDIIYLTKTRCCTTRQVIAANLDGPPDALEEVWHIER